MVRALIFLLGALALPRVARADLVPSGKKIVPRHLEIRDLDRAPDDVLVLAGCQPAHGSDFAQDYCVIESSGSFRLFGTAYFVPRRSIHTEPVKDSVATPTAPRAVRIQELSRYGLETTEFFQKSPLARATGLRAVDGVTLSMFSDIIKVTDVWRVARDTNGAPILQADKTVFQCFTGEKLERTPPRDPLREPPEIPACPRDRKPASTPAASASAPVNASADANPTQTKSLPELAAALGIGFLLIGAVAALASRKRAE